MTVDAPKKIAAFSRMVVKVRWITRPRSNWPLRLTACPAPLGEATD